MDLENCHEEEQETRQKKPFQGGNNGLLLEARESGRLEEKGRYAPHSGCRSKCAKPGSACSLPGRALLADANPIRLGNDHSSNTLHIA